jgi:hypothetical protein
MSSYSMAPDNGRVNRVAKLIINPQTGPIPCCWDTCDKPARSIYVMRVHEHAAIIPCEAGQHAHYSFCSPHHGRYFAMCMGWSAHETSARNGGNIYGYLQPGSRHGRLR